MAYDSESELDSIFDLDSDDSNFEEKQPKVFKGPTETSKPKLNKHLLQLKEKLGLDSFKKKEDVASTSKVQHKSNGTNQGPQPLVVVYNNPSKRRKAKPLPAVAPPSNDPPPKQSLAGPEFNINKAKHEVKRLAITAIKGKGTKEQARAALAISLGAVPPKRAPVNYKDFKKKHKKELKRLDKQKKSDQVFIQRVSVMAKKKDNKRKNKNKVTNFDGNFGKIGVKR